MRLSHEIQLYLMTLHFLGIHDLLIPENCNARCVDATIINRAYYSSYLYCELWLWKIHHFRPKHKWEFKKGQKFEGEHNQVRTALSKFGANDIKYELKELAKLRKKADYQPNKKITKNEVKEAITRMEYIFNNLKFS